MTFCITNYLHSVGKESSENDSSTSKLLEKDTTKSKGTISTNGMTLFLSSSSFFFL